MKKLFNKVKSTFAKTSVAVSNNKGEGFVDSGVKILIAVVIGALLLGGLYSLFGDLILPNLMDRIMSLFYY